MGTKWGRILWIIAIGIVIGIGLFIMKGWPDQPATNVVTVPTSLSPANVTPTPLPSPTTPLMFNSILFPGVASAGVIVEVPRVPRGWDVQNLQSLVGHLEGTAWFGDSGNTVLAGHFEDEVGRSGPFRYLYEAQVGDHIIIQSETMMVYEVQQVFSTAPDDLEVLRHTDAPRLTLITCDAWNYKTKRYEERLVVVAVPLYQDAPTTTPNLSNGVN
ncbi:MAG: sortase [Anaerolineae bacterium]|nr:sortase [Anaerolineae bacterium]